MWQSLFKSIDIRDFFKRVAKTISFPFKISRSSLHVLSAYNTSTWACSLLEYQHNAVHIGILTFRIGLIRKRSCWTSWYTNCFTYRKGLISKWSISVAKTAVFCNYWRVARCVWKMCSICGFSRSYSVCSKHCNIFISGSVSKDIGHTVSHDVGNISYKSKILCPLVIHRIKSTSALW